jgi:hypothetical protein
MAKDFSVEFSMREAPSEAQARAASALVEPARAVGLRMTERGANELRYKPRVQFPFLIMLWHNLKGEQMTIKFEPGEQGGTHVRISGAVASGNYVAAADPEHWSEALGDSLSS